jgi:hypothetical protein
MNRPTSTATAKAYDFHSATMWKGRARGQLSNKTMRLRRAWKRMGRRAERREGRVDVAGVLEQYRCAGCRDLDCQDFWCETYTPAQRAAREAEEERYLDHMYSEHDECLECHGVDCGDEPEPYDSDPYGDAYDDRYYGDFYD